MEWKAVGKLILASTPMTLGLIASMYFIVAFIVLAFMRANFPFGLEWVEGAMVDQVRRLMAGHPLYAEPTLDNVPFPYTPLYIYLGVVFSKIFGIGYYPLRLISILSTAGCLLLLFSFIRRETGRATYGIIAAGLFAATFRLNAYWFDLARVDMLFFFLIAASAYLIRFGENSRMLVFAGIMAVLAFFTKQTALGPILALTIYALIFKRPMVWWFIAVVVIGLTSGMAMLDYIYDGWYGYYTITVPGNHGVLWHRVSTFWGRDFLFPLFPMLAVMLFYLLACARGRSVNKICFSFLFVGSLFGVAFLSRIKVGGACNTLIPMHFGAALLSGLALGCLNKSEKEIENKSSFQLMRVLLPLILLPQFLIGIYSPERFLPPKDAVVNGEKALDTLAEIPGDVWVVRYNNISSRLDKGYGTHRSLINDILKVKSTKKEFREKLLEPIKHVKYGAVVVNQKAIPAFIRNDLLTHYKKTNKFIRLLQWQTHKGWHTTKEYVYLPKS